MTKAKYRFECSSSGLDWPRRYIIYSNSGQQGEPDVLHATCHTKRMAALICRLLNAHQKVKSSR